METLWHGGADIIIALNGVEKEQTEACVVALGILTMAPHSLLTPRVPAMAAMAEVECCNATYVDLHYFPFC